MEFIRSAAPLFALVFVFVFVFVLVFLLVFVLVFAVLATFCGERTRPGAKRTKKEGRTPWRESQKKNGEF